MGAARITAQTRLACRRRTVCQVSIDSVCLAKDSARSRQRMSHRARRSATSIHRSIVQLHDRPFYSEKSGRFPFSSVEVVGWLFSPTLLAFCAPNTNRSLRPGGSCFRPGPFSFVVEDKTMRERVCCLLRFSRRLARVLTTRRNKESL